MFKKKNKARKMKLNFSATNDQGTGQDGHGYMENAIPIHSEMSLHTHQESRIGKEKLSVYNRNAGE